MVDDGRGAGCFRVDGSGGRYTVHGGGVLGVQYGLAQLRLLVLGEHSTIPGCVL